MEAPVGPFTLSDPETRIGGGPLKQMTKPAEPVSP
jgi:hypothetical protein